LSLNSILGFCSALELGDVVFSDYHRRANLLMYNTIIGEWCEDLMDT